MIIPGLLIILFIGSPLWCATLVALSFPLYWIYKRWCDRTDYKRRTPMYILSVLSLIITSAIAVLYIHLGWLDTSIDKVFGVLVPAIIAFNFTRQKMEEVTRGTVLTTLGTAVIILLICSVCAFGLALNSILLRRQRTHRNQIPTAATPSSSSGWLSGLSVY